MKLQEIVLPGSLAVSTPTTVPAGAFWATVKLLIVIVMSSPVSEPIGSRLLHERQPSARCL
jgi:hypothetical protein